MSKVFMVGDLHFGHKNVAKFRTQFTDERHHTETIIKNWNNEVGKHDKVFVLGDACFTKDALKDIARLNGTKILIAGNHDILKASDYLTVFRDIKGITSYKGCWLSHAPIHPLELRGRYNIHGHVHTASVPHDSYFNACLENTMFYPEPFTEIKEYLQR